MKIPVEYQDFYIIGNCLLCVGVQELKYIKALSLEELPLNINRPWVFEASKQLFQKRFRTEIPSNLEGK